MHEDLGDDRKITNEIIAKLSRRACYTTIGIYTDVAWVYMDIAVLSDIRSVNYKPGVPMKV